MTKKTTTGALRGRPPHKPTAATRRQVSIAAGGGMWHKDIAIALGITDVTLLKWYPKELSVGANMRRMEALHGLYLAAKKGSSSAAKAYLAVQPELAAPPAVDGDEPRPPIAAAGSPAPAAEQKQLAKPLGKKEQAQADAATAQVGTKWEGLLDPPAMQQ